MRYLVITLLFFIHLNAKSLEPSHIYEGSGSVTDLVYKDSKLYSATVEGAVDIYDTKEQKLIETIKVPTIKDFMGDEVASKVYSVDIVNTKIMIASQGKQGYRRVHIYENKTLKEIISVDKFYTISKAKFVDEDTLLIALLSNELVLYDIKNNNEIYRKQISASKFSDYALSENKDELALADESGEIKLISVKDGSVLNEFKGQNVDNIFQIDYKNGTIVTAGQDRRAAIYYRSAKSAYYKDGTFLIYSVGLSPSGRVGGYAADENNNVTIFNTDNKSDMYILGSHKATISSILFIDENELFTASDDNHINYWKL